MREVLSKLAQRGWNCRPLTLDDFDIWCDQEGVRVITLPMPARGLYLVRHGYPLIVLNESLRGPDRLFVAWHEFAHHLLHTPESCYFGFGLEEKAQYQANLIAACALIPRASLASPDPDLPADLLRLRWQIYQRSRY